ncbi:uncharacterized protein LOC115996873 [Ipomoea triloba]|uniref:uncharacterized protein LOC115996873 n=1 Tax=Ipomoea triloba TaxID=35885 RepID=UPI00125DCC42|nr:uncharacterized protein LOC115996873 [Ipomoea triloba]
MSTSDISSMCANLTLADVDDEDISMQVPNVLPDSAEPEDGLYAVCRVVTEKHVKYSFFLDTMAGVWRPAMGVNMRQLQPHRFLVRFYHEADITRVLSEGPWTFEQCLLIMQRVVPGDDPERMVLQHSEFWIQIHSLPAGFRSEAVVSAIGSFLGTLVCTDERNFDGAMRVFYRVRVAIDITKPLKKQMKLKRENGTWAFIDFRYERLPTFCFLCGVIGHGDRFCSKILHGVDLKAEKPYGAWLRAGTRRNAPTTG